MFKQILPYLFYLAGSISFGIGSIICIMARPIKEGDLDF